MTTISVDSFSLIPGVAIQATVTKDPLTVSPKKRTTARTPGTQRVRTLA